MSGPAKPRRRLAWTLAAAGVLLVAAIVLALLTSPEPPPFDAPWTVWAPRIGPPATKMLDASYGTPSVEIGGPPIDGRWDRFPEAGGALARFEPLSLIEKIRYRGNTRPIDRCWVYVRTDEDQVDAAGVVWTRHFVTPNIVELAAGAPEPACVGTWVVMTLDGKRTRIDLAADGRVTGPDFGGNWAVRGDVLLIQAGSGGRVIDWELTTLLDADHRTFRGRRTHDAAKVAGARVLE